MLFLDSLGVALIFASYLCWEISIFFSCSVADFEFPDDFVKNWVRLKNIGWNSENGEYKLNHFKVLNSRFETKNRDQHLYSSMTSLDIYSTLHSEFLATFGLFCAMPFGGGGCFSANLGKIN